MNKYKIKIDERLKQSFINICIYFNRICSSNPDFDYSDTMGKTIVDSFKEITVNINELTNVLQDIFPNGMRGMMNYDSVKTMGVKVSEAVSNYAVHAELPHQPSKIDFSPVFLREFINSNYFIDLISVAYKVMQKIPDRIMNEDDPLESGFSSVEELEDEINKCINNKASWEGFACWTQKKKSQYFKIWHLLFFLCACFIQMYIQENISLPVKADKAANVRKQPQLNAEVVCLLKENTEAIILEDNIHYYRIAFIDGDDIKKEGYVSKRSVRLINEEI